MTTQIGRRLGLSNLPSHAIETIIPVLFWSDCPYREMRLDDRKRAWIGRRMSWGMGVSVDRERCRM